MSRRKLSRGDAEAFGQRLVAIHDMLELVRRELRDVEYEGWTEGVVEAWLDVARIGTRRAAGALSAEFAFDLPDEDDEDDEDGTDGSDGGGTPS